MPTVAPISQQIWDMKYRLKGPDGDPVDKTIEDTWARVAKALAAAENDPAGWEPRFYQALEDFRFLPAGRILAGAGADRSVTLFNCFVMGTIPDDMGGIFENLKEAALTMQQGGGIGYDFSTLRPKGARVRGVGADASGPLTFMDVWDSMCRTIMSAGHRRGAMMATMRCDHPDIEAFIAAKQEPGRLRMFNLSVLVSDAFMQAVRDDAAWDLVFQGMTFKTLPARELWEQIMRATYAFAEPGVIYIDRINALNPLSYAESISATNPCGEQPLPPYGACLLGSINLARLIDNPFEKDAGLDEGALDDLAHRRPHWPGDHCASDPGEALFVDGLGEGERVDRLILALNRLSGGPGGLLALPRLVSGFSTPEAEPLRGLDMRLTALSRGVPLLAAISAANVSCGSSWRASCRPRPRAAGRRRWR